MDLTKITLDQFLGIPNLQIAEADPNTFHFVEPTLRAFVGQQIRTLGSGYDLCGLGGFGSDVCITSAGKLVGFYHSQILAIDPAHGGQQLSVPLILAAVPGRPLPPSRNLSTAGKIALTRAWEVANGLRPDPWP